MARLFGIASVQMAVVPWDAPATVKKIDATVHQISNNFPWVDMIVFHELVVPGLVQFVPMEKPYDWPKNAESIPAALTSPICQSRT